MIMMIRLRRKFKKYFPLFLIIILPFLLGFILYLSYPVITGGFVASPDSSPPSLDVSKPLFTDLENNPLDVEGFTEVDVEAIPGALVLKKNCTAVLIYMSNLKSFSIKRGIENTLDIRPNYHDLTYDIIDHYGGKVIMAKVSRLKNDFYYADLFIEQDGDILHLDSRPSDAVGISSRFKAPVYVKNNIFEKQGKKIC